MFAEPRDACQDLSNAGNLTSQHVLLVARGTCTFGTKAKNANKTNASAIIIINNEPGLAALTMIAFIPVQYCIHTYDNHPTPKNF